MGYRYDFDRLRVNFLKLWSQTTAMKRLIATCSLRRLFCCREIAQPYHVRITFCGVLYHTWLAVMIMVMSACYYKQHIILQNFIYCQMLVAIYNCALVLRCHVENSEKDIYRRCSHTVFHNV